jgi:ribonucleotide reductase beta subunit family protein with ferritin-like domain
MKTAKEIKNIGFFLAFPKFKTSEFEVYSACGVSFLEKDIVTHNTKLLAAQDNTSSLNSLKRVIQRLKEELDMPFYGFQKSILAYTYSLAQEIVVDKKIDENLARIGQLCSENEYHKQLFRFYSLHWAWYTLKTSRKQYYWPEMDRDNAEDKVLEYTSDWLDEYNHIVDIPIKIN